MRVFYRISDASYIKHKLPGTNKLRCFSSALTSLGGPLMHIIADRCNVSLSFLKNYPGYTITETDLGNAGSLLYAIKKALGFEDNTIVYFAEDDYLYNGKVIDIISEGLTIADYVTLYDHPDKYTEQYGYGETSKVYRTKSTHWRLTESTCMTFATTVATLRYDYSTWLPYISDDHPNDHAIFSALTHMGRKLAVCIPGMACHTDLTFSGHARKILIEPWAIQQAISFLMEEFDLIQDDSFQKVYKEITNGLTGWDLLKRLESLRYMQEIK